MSPAAPVVWLGSVTVRETKVEEPKIEVDWALHLVDRQQIVKRLLSAEFPHNWGRLISPTCDDPLHLCSTIDLGIMIPEIPHRRENLCHSLYLLLILNVIKSTVVIVDGKVVAVLNELL